MHFKIAKKKKKPPPKNFYDQVTYILMFVFFYGSQRYFIFIQNLPGATVIFENVKFSGRVYKVQNLQYTCTCNNLEFQYLQPVNSKSTIFLQFKTYDTSGVHL